jgi:glutamate/tyrosine decarboxylase-like PLP-dependent enzyme
LDHEVEVAVAHEVSASPETWDRVLDTTVQHAREFLAQVGQRPVAPSAGAAQLRELLGGRMPDEPEDPADVVSLIARAGQVGTMASAGPRFFGFVMGAAVPAAVGADWLVGAWDQNAAAYVPSPVASVAEEVVADWVRELLGLPAHCSVGFVTGGQMATFTALATARHHLLARAGWDVEAQGLGRAPTVTVLATEERHASIDRALRLLGIGTDALRAVRCGPNGVIDPDALADAFDTVVGPTIVCVQAGNINTGGVDPLDIVCEIAHRRQAWVHVDGAVGLWAVASPEIRPIFAGVERADSWSTDAHKWLNTPFDCGIVVCAHPDAHHATTGIAAPYIVMSAERDEFEWTPEWSRRARSLPLYAAMRSLGRTGIVELVERCCAYARRFASQLDAITGISVLNDVVLNQVLVRFDDPDGDHDSLTDDVVRRIQQDGTCWMGGTTWRGMRAMRISVSNWNTTSDDVDRSVAAILKVHTDALHARAANG